MSLLIDGTGHQTSIPFWYQLKCASSFEIQCSKLAWSPHPLLYWSEGFWWNKRWRLYMCGCFCLDNVEHLTTPTLINKDIVQNVLPFLTLKYLKKKSILVLVQFYLKNKNTFIWHNGHSILITNWWFTDEELHQFYTLRGVSSSFSLRQQFVYSTPWYLNLWIKKRNKTKNIVMSRVTSAIMGLE